MEWYRKQHWLFFGYTVDNKQLYNHFIPLFNMRVLKKYANRRLYDTENSCYITLDDVRNLILNFQKISVVDSSTGEDITEQILLQIITHQESNKSHKQIFTRNLLEQLIRLYSLNHNFPLSDYLEKSLSFFVDSLSQQPTNPMEMWMNFGQKQMEMWQQAFTPPGARPADSPDDKGKAD